MHARRGVKWSVCALGLGLSVAGCKCSETVALRPGVPAQLIELDPGLLGVSGLGLDPQGRAWVVSERTRELDRLQGEAGAWRVAERVRVSGDSRDRDLESLSWVSASTIAFGTEGRGDRATDQIELTRPDGSAITAITIDWQAGFGVSAPDNQGIEGLCSAGDRLVVAGEAVESRAGVRRSPIVIVGGVEQRPRWLELTSDRGRISGLACRDKGRQIEVLAIERHFEVARIIRFEIDPEAAPRSAISAELLFDLAPWFVGKIPNFEGLAQLADGRLILVSDNDYGGRSGPTWLLVLEAFGPQTPTNARPDDAR